MNRLTVLYVCPDHTMGGSTRSLLDLIVSVKEYVYPIVLFSSKDVAYNTFVRCGIECIIFPYIKLYNSYPLRNVLLHPWRLFLIRLLRYDVKSSIHIRKYLKGRNIDIVHSNYSPIIVGAILAKMLSAKHVWHVREFIDLFSHVEICGGFNRLKKLVNTADARIAISSAIKSHWQMPDDNTWIINNAIRSKTDVCILKPKEKYLLFSSYVLTEAKGTRVAIIAFAKSGVMKNGYVLKLMGSCHKEYKESLIKTASEYGVESAIEFIPCQSDVKPFYSYATAFIMASECEGLGRVTAEAMFYGCPVIANASGGTLDLIKDGVTGHLYNSIEVCVEKIKLVCSTSQTDIILHAQDFAINNLSIEVYGPKILNVYNQLCNLN